MNLTGTVKNLMIEYSFFSGNSLAGAFASLVSPTGVILNCTSVYNHVNCTGSGKSAAGGFSGENRGLILESISKHNRILSHSTSDASAGGVSGNQLGFVSNVISQENNLLAVSTAANSAAGSVSGIQHGNISFAVTTGNDVKTQASGSMNAYSGGISGVQTNMANTTTCQSSSNEMVATSKDSCAGGVVGELLSGQISDCLIANIHNSAVHTGSCVGLNVNGTVLGCE